MSKKAYLPYINNSDDLRKLRPDELEKVCKELRQFIIDAVSTNPGHFGASLGVVDSLNCGAKCCPV